MQKLGKHDAVDAVVPKGWKQGFLDDEMDPTDSRAFGFGTSMRVGGTCGGMCESKDAAKWEKIGNKSFFDNFATHTPAPKIIKDDKAPGRRTMIVEDTATDGNVNNTYVVVASWQDGADRLYFCDVTLAPESKELAPVMELACRAAIAP